ncbi:MAG: MBL fold metallo-hydrolase [Chitinophagales bacterium]|jgi:glyoxylase-like metal-dependent hydrolase (beta-lactamase superfamily II)|nr:MBL fold metallo-hydrolase [Chitinophagales bacterium]
MLSVHVFTFNPFQENTYILQKGNHCMIIDAGNSNASENQALKSFVERHKLIPTAYLQTHLHIDHILGNRFVYDTWGLKPKAHKLDLYNLENAEKVSEMYGIPYLPSPEIEEFIEETSSFVWENESFEIFHTPGHSLGSICLYHAASNQLISGDTLFHMSIGRADLPGGDMETLLHSIRTKLFILPDETMVYPGHGDSTTIGFEKANNPFFR